jgi:outer membrane protein assembly factor BamD
MDVNMHLTRSLTGLTALGLVVVLGALATGCGAKNKTLPSGGTEPDKYLFDQGTQALNSKRWMRSREYFRRIVDEYPQSRYRPEAKLGLGDAYLNENSTESLILAGNEFREFLTYYPTHERAHYAQLKLAFSHYKQMLAPQRDQTQTRDALKEYQNFVERFPNSPLINEGEAKLQECKDRLSDADYQVGYHYYRAKWYPGSISRFRAVLKDNPTYTRRDALYWYLSDGYIRMGLAPEAAPLLDRLVKEFEKSEFLARAQRTLAEIENGTIGSFANTNPAKGDAKKAPEKKDEKK